LVRRDRAVCNRVPGSIRVGAGCRGRKARGLGCGVRGVIRRERQVKSGSRCSRCYYVAMATCDQMRFGWVRLWRRGLACFSAVYAGARGCALALAVIACVLSASCERRGEGGTPSGKPLVVCTTGMVADLARSIGGDRVEVRALMGPGVDPHLYKASPGDVRLLESASMVLYSGLHLEGRMLEPIKAMAKFKPVIAIGEAVPVDQRRTFEGGHDGDPHVWMDASLWSLAALRMRDELIKLAPADKDGFTARAEQIAAQMAELHVWAKRRLAQIPPDRRVLVTAHDAFNYFGRAYGVEVMAIQGVSTDSEAGLRDMNALVETLVSRKIKAVFVETSVPQRTIQALVEGCKARGHEIVIGGELYSDALGGPGSGAETYAGMLRHNVETIAKALGAGPEPASPGGAGERK